MSNIGQGFLANIYIGAMYEMLVAYDFLLCEMFHSSSWEELDG